jgi:hypothetical protein
VRSFNQISKHSGGLKPATTRITFRDPAIRRSRMTLASLLDERDQHSKDAGCDVPKKLIL